MQRQVAETTKAGQSSKLLQLAQWRHLVSAPFIDADTARDYDRIKPMLMGYKSTSTFGKGCNQIDHRVFNSTMIKGSKLLHQLKQNVLENVFESCVISITTFSARKNFNTNIVSPDWGAQSDNRSIDRLVS